MLFFFFFVRVVPIKRELKLYPLPEMLALLIQKYRGQRKTLLISVHLIGAVVRGYYLAHSHHR